jgi:secretion/DNA translocation related TadE-like protein
MITRLRQSHEDGVAMVWALALFGLLLTATSIAAVVIMQAVARQRVAAIADVAALVGAQTLTDPCASAASSAYANDATLQACVFDGRDIVVTISQPAPEFVARVLMLFGQPSPQVYASARAGPS